MSHNETDAFDLRRTPARASSRSMRRRRFPTRRSCQRGWSTNGFIARASPFSNGRMANGRAALTSPPAGARTTRPRPAALRRCQRPRRSIPTSPFRPAASCSPPSASASPPRSMWWRPRTARRFRSITRSAGARIFRRRLSARARAAVRAGPLAARGRLRLRRGRAVVCRRSSANRDVFPGLSARASLKLDAGRDLGPQRGRIPGPQRPGLIEASRITPTRRRGLLCVFPGLSTRASLKHSQSKYFHHGNRVFPGLSARASLKHGRPDPGRGGVRRYPGPQRPGLIEAHRPCTALQSRRRIPGRRRRRKRCQDWKRRTWTRSRRCKSA